MIEHNNRPLDYISKVDSWKAACNGNNGNMMERVSLDRTPKKSNSTYDHVPTDDTPTASAASPEVQYVFVPINCNSTTSKKANLRKNLSHSKISSFPASKLQNSFRNSNQVALIGNVATVKKLCKISTMSAITSNQQLILSPAKLNLSGVRGRQVSKGTSRTSGYDSGMVTVELN